MDYDFVWLQIPFNKKCGYVNLYVKFMLIPFSYEFLPSRALVIRITTYFIFQKNLFYPKTSYTRVCFCIPYNVQQILALTEITDWYFEALVSLTT